MRGYHVESLKKSKTSRKKGIVKKKTVSLHHVKVKKIAL